MTSQNWANAGSAKLGAKEPIKRGKKWMALRWVVRYEQEQGKIVGGTGAFGGRDFLLQIMSAATLELPKPSYRCHPKSSPV